MSRKPEKQKGGLFNSGMWGQIFVQGTMIGMLTLLSFIIGNEFYGIEIGRSMAFTTLSLAELIHSFNIKTDESVFKTKLMDNPYLVISFLTGGLLQIAVVGIRPIASIFGCATLDLTQWLITIAISICPIVIMEVQKKINEIKFGKRIYSFER